MTNINAQEYGLDFTVTLTAEDAKFTDEAVAAGVPLIVVSMFRDALRKLVASEREACAKVAENGRFLHDDSPEARFGKSCAAAIRARGQE
jgi:hypothetical protein